MSNKAPLPRLTYKRRDGAAPDAQPPTVKPEQPVVKQEEGAPGAQALPIEDPALDARATALELEALTPDAPVEVEMDAQRVGQVLANLIGNAIKFTPPGGRVQVSLRGDAGHVRVEVADTGVGIDTAHLPHLFERFYQAEGGLTRHTACNVRSASRAPAPAFFQSPLE